MGIPGLTPGAICRRRWAAESSSHIYCVVVPDLSTESRLNKAYVRISEVILWWALKTCMTHPAMGISLGRQSARGMRLLRALVAVGAKIAVDEFTLARCLAVFFEQDQFVGLSSLQPRFG